jgi:hypothetical protein
LSERLSYVLDHWDGSALAAFWEADTLGDVDAAENADALRLEVDVADAEREKFAEPAAGEGGGQIDRAVLFRSGARFLRECWSLCGLSAARTSACTSSGV